MGNNNSVLTSSAKVTNYLPQRIKVTVDCSRSLTKLVSVKNCINLEAPIGSLSAEGCYSYEYEAFHVVPTADSFTIIDSKESDSFALDFHRNKYAFLTIWTENTDGSWSVYCENHPIMKRSEISVALNKLMEQYLVVHQIDHDHNIPVFKTKGAVWVHNDSTKKIWVRIDADDIEITKQSIGGSVRASAGDCCICESPHYTAETLVYYRAQQGRGYTVINKGERAQFYLNIPRNIIYISIDYEGASGKIEKRCFNHPVEYRTKSIKIPPIISIKNTEERIAYDIKRSKRTYMKGVIHSFGLQQ